jgi:hypothetical protein
LRGQGDLALAAAPRNPTNLRAKMPESAHFRRNFRDIFEQLLRNQARTGRRRSAAIETAASI